METKLCKCGCGHPAGKRWEYKRGHAPKGTKSSSTPPRKQTAKSLAVIEPVFEIGPQPEEEYLALEINGPAYDRIFSMLTLRQKNIAIGAALCADEDE
jgi:hypothetical protein